MIQLFTIIYIAHNANALLVLGKLNKFFRVTFKKIYLFIIPYIIIIAFVLGILLLLSLFAAFFKFIPFNVRLFFNLFVFVVFFNWAKRYIGLVVKKAV